MPGVARKANIDPARLLQKCVCGRCRSVKLPNSECGECTAFFESKRKLPRHVRKDLSTASNWRLRTEASRQASRQASLLARRQKRIDEKSKRLELRGFMLDALRMLLFSIEIDDDGTPAIAQDKQNDVLRMLLTRPPNLFAEIAQEVEELERLMERSNDKRARLYIQIPKVSSVKIPAKKDSKSAKDKVIDKLRAIQRQAQVLESEHISLG